MDLRTQASPIRYLDNFLMEGIFIASAYKFSLEQIFPINLMLGHLSVALIQIFFYPGKQHVTETN